MSLITVEELRSYLRAGEAGVPVVGSREAEEEFLELLCAGASLRAGQHTGRLFSPDPEPTEGDPDPDPVERAVFAAGERLVAVPDVREIVTVTLDSDTTALTSGFRLIARPGEPATLLKLDRCAREVRLVGHFGFIEPPADVKLAVLEMAARAFHNAQSRVGDRVVDPDGGVTSYFRQLPPEAKGTLDGYRAPRPIPIF